MSQLIERLAKVPTVCYGVLATLCSQRAQTENVIQKHCTNINTDIDTDTYTNTHWLAPLQKARMKKSMYRSVSFVRTYTITVCLVCLFYSLCWQFICMHAQAALCHSKQIVRAHTHTHLLSQAEQRIAQHIKAICCMWVSTLRKHT